MAFEASALWGAAAGLFAFTGFYNFARSLKDGSVSINAPIFRLSFTITAALAVLFLGESLGLVKIAGLTLALAAVWLLLAAPAGDAPAQRSSRSSLVLVLIATAAMGIANLLYKIGLTAGATPATPLVTQAMVFVSLATGFLAAIERGPLPAAATWRHAPAAAFLQLAAFIMLFESLARGEASVLVPIAQMGFVVTALLGFARLREPVTPRKIAGLLFALAALASLANS